MSSDVKLLNACLRQFHTISGKNAANDDACPPAKRQRTNWMDIKELANFLREEYNLVTEFPLHIRDSIIVTPDATSLYSYYLRQLISRDYRMTQNDFFMNRLPIYLPAIAQLRQLPDGGIAQAIDLVLRVAHFYYHKLTSPRSYMYPIPHATKVFQILDEAMLALSLDLWDHEPDRWRTHVVRSKLSATLTSDSCSGSGPYCRLVAAADMRALIDRVRPTRRAYASSDHFLHRTAQFLQEMDGVATARMLAARVVGDRLPPELVGEVERQLLNAWRLPYLPTAQAVRRLWVPRPVPPVCPLDWKRCSRTCPNIMEIDWVVEERRFVYFHQGRQRCRLAECKGHHDFIPDDPFDTNFLRYRTEVGPGFSD
ncbi:MAG: hypothetical protein M1821_008125 [Bathelium mastoideum]|nr:MAG: hypothetical protein M1821_008125 [Bathelium mastoideum]KAI9693167.1 MAG: hypothetical protein M1822_005163 [Bathelium mastoideum]